MTQFSGEVARSIATKGSESLVETEHTSTRRHLKHLCVLPLHTELPSSAPAAPRVASSTWAP